jgi:hypothetical protein
MIRSAANTGRQDDFRPASSAFQVSKRPVYSPPTDESIAAGRCDWRPQRLDEYAGIAAAE